MLIMMITIIMLLLLFEFVVVVVDIILKIFSCFSNDNVGTNRFSV